ncbi:hypothetical protein M5K25_009372 [Dendrobium thyrsiflorum]|uniref:Uncharacterized protein n=1 Tax=Dendrobium thyrsiflorum TaxID=117978 RepID=A0ABD0V5Z8_DENTH
MYENPPKLNNAHLTDKERITSFECHEFIEIEKVQAPVSCTPSDATALHRKIGSRQLSLMLRVQYMGSFIPILYTNPWERKLREESLSGKDPVAPPHREGERDSASPPHRGGERDTITQPHWEDERDTTTPPHYDGRNLQRLSVLLIMCNYPNITLKSATRIWKEIGVIQKGTKEAEEKIRCWQLPVTPTPAQEGQAGPVQPGPVLGLLLGLLVLPEIWRVVLPLELKNIVSLAVFLLPLIRRFRGDDEDKQKPATTETTGSHGRGGNPNPFRGRENPKEEVLEGDDGMPPLIPLSRKEMSMGYDRRGADFVERREEFYRRGADFEGRREEFHRRGADFEGRRGEYDEGFGNYYVY